MYVLSNEKVFKGKIDLTDAAEVAKMNAFVIDKYENVYEREYGNKKKYEKRLARANKLQKIKLAPASSNGHIGYGRHYASKDSPYRYFWEQVAGKDLKNIQKKMDENGTGFDDAVIVKDMQKNPFLNIARNFRLAAIEHEIYHKDWVFDSKDVYRPTNRHRKWVAAEQSGRTSSGKSSTNSHQASPNTSKTPSQWREPASLSPHIVPDESNTKFRKYFSFNIQIKHG